MSMERNELELAREENARLKERLAMFQKMEEHLIPLPNGDLHRGMKNRLAESNIDVDVVPESQGNPLDRAVAKCLKAAKNGENLTCLWCGMQYGIPGPQNLGGEKNLREHLKETHKSIVEGYDKMVPEILMQNLAEANARLAAAGT